MGVVRSSISIKRLYEKLFGKTMRIISALKEEFDSADYEMITDYSGVGKVNAAITAMEVIKKHKPEVIINVGTVGALDSSRSGLYECGIFQDRDLLGDFRPEIIITNINGYLCSTGDRFLDKTPFRGVKVEGRLEPDFVDMEAFAIATVCQKYEIKFVCFKFVTDYVNEASSINWKDNIGKGNQLFREAIDDYLSNAV